MTTLDVVTDFQKFGTDKSTEGPSSSPMEPTQLTPDSQAGDDEGGTTTDEEEEEDRENRPSFNNKAITKKDVKEIKEEAVDAGDGPEHRGESISYDSKENTTRKKSESDKEEEERASSEKEINDISWKHDRYFRHKTGSKNSIITPPASSVQRRERSRTPPTRQEKGSHDAGPSNSGAGITGGNQRYKYSSKLNSHFLPTLPGLALPNPLIPPMEMLLPPRSRLALLQKQADSISSLDAYFPMPAPPPPPPADDQPLDLSKKPDKERTNSSKLSSSMSSKSPVSASSSSSSSASITNGFSSLQSLQQRFGGEYPLELSQKAGATIIPLQPSVLHKTGSHGHHLAGDPMIRAHGVPHKSEPMVRPEWMEKRESDSRSPLSNSPGVVKGEQSRQSSPGRVSPDELIGSEVAGSKHTIHRCSCHRSFSTLYALSLHLQESGHVPSSNKASSLMDYPKLVRGQDMWLNQESEQTRRILRCMQCGESFKSLPLLTVHMMQTQHYTKIVSSDHGRRSHKCSTYCDRELDKECIFKCKICHEAFSDMEGLANHMIVSGHHKKTSSRTLANTAAAVSEAAAALISQGAAVASAASMSSLARQGRRKRFLPEEMMSALPSATTSVASLMEYRQKPPHTITNPASVNGVHLPNKKVLDKKSTEHKAATLKPKLCDSCGARIHPDDFDVHVRACLRQRAEVIDALKSKLAVEEAILSRSESKLLKSGFSLSSITGHSSNALHCDSESGSLSREKESPPYKMPRRESESPSHELDMSVKKLKQEKILQSVNGENSSISEEYERSSTASTSMKVCDLVEVPLKKWYCSGDTSRLASKKDDGRDKELSPKLPNKAQSDDNHTSIEKPATRNVSERIKQELADPDEAPKTIRESSMTNSETVEATTKRKLSETDSADRNMNQDGDERRKSAKLNHCYETEPGETSASSTDFTSSALHKLDMFSRGLQLSPPRRSFSPQLSGSVQHMHKSHKKKEMASPGSGRKDSVPKSPLPSSSLSPHVPGQLKGTSSPVSQKEVTFDIIDPNADVEEKPSSSSGSALEAMESFIEKSFSANSDIRTSNLASMFSPFGSCFPLPGSIPGQAVAPVDHSDPALSYFAKFSKFFRMIPGATAGMPDMNSSFFMANRQVKPGMMVKSGKQGSPHEKINPAASLKKPGTKPTHMQSSATVSSSSLPSSSSATIKVPVVKFPQGQSNSHRDTTNSSSDTSISKRDSNSEQLIYKKSKLDSSSTSKEAKISQAHKDEGDFHSKDNGKFGEDGDGGPRSPTPVNTDSKNRAKPLNFLGIDGDDEDNDTNVESSGVSNQEIDPLGETSDKEDADVLKGKNSERKSDTVTLRNQVQLTKSAKPVLPKQKSKPFSKTKALPSEREEIDANESNSQPAVVKEEPDAYHDIEVRQEHSPEPSTISDCKEETDNFLEDSPKSASSPLPTDQSLSDLSSVMDTDRKDENQVNNSSKTSKTGAKMRNCTLENAEHPSSKDCGNQDSENGNQSPNRSSKVIKLEKPSRLEKIERSSSSPKKFIKYDAEDEKCSNQSDSQTILSANNNSESKNSDKNQKQRNNEITPLCSKEEQGTSVDQKCHLSGSAQNIAKKGTKPSSSPQNVKTEIEEETCDSSVSIGSDVSCGRDGKENNDQNEERNLEKSRKDKIVSVTENNVSEDTPVKNKNRSSSRNSDNSDTNENIRNEEKDDGEEEDDGEKNKKDKRSALDSLSTFVYSQPLRSEHPLDSLQKLLTTNTLSPTSPHHLRNQSAPSAACTSPSSILTSTSVHKRGVSDDRPKSAGSPLNLSVREGDNGNCGKDGGGSSAEEDNEENNEVLSGTEGTASEGEFSEYKCAACNRRFASKGSYRYHLSRCHLSSVKKFGIKEAFNMSPYVYLPLDHNAKFSKYYKMAHELANKSK